MHFFFKQLKLSIFICSVSLWSLPIAVKLEYTRENVCATVYYYFCCGLKGFKPEILFNNSPYSLDIAPWNFSPPLHQITFFNFKITSLLSTKAAQINNYKLREPEINIDDEEEIFVFVWALGFFGGIARLRTVLSHRFLLF